jgi:hypothetical protein
MQRWLRDGRIHAGLGGTGDACTVEGGRCRIWLDSRSKSARILPALSGRRPNRRDTRRSLCTLFGRNGSLIRKGRPLCFSLRHVAGRSSQLHYKDMDIWALAFDHSAYPGSSTCAPTVGANFHHHFCDDGDS